MKRLNLAIVLVAVLAMVLSACAAPAAPAGDSGAAADSGGAAAAMECTDAIGCIELADGDPINVGAMLTISGATAFLGEDSRGGVELAIDDRGGEMLGHPIDLTVEDSLCSAEGGQTAAQKIASDPTIVGVVGTNCSSAAAAALPIISSAGLVLISPSNTAPSLTDADAEAGGIWQPGYYRTAHNDLFQGRVAAEYAYNELGARTLATIHDGSPYADGLQAVAADVFAQLGGEVTFQGAVNVGDTDMRPILTEIASNPPDVLYFPIFEPESNFIAAQAKETPGLEDTILMSADGSLVDSFPENTGEAAVGMYLSGPYVAGDTYSEFLGKWDAKFGGSPPSGFHAHAYDATNMLLNAVEQVAQVGDDGSVLIGRQALRDALSSVSEYQGLTGVLTCNETGDCATGEALGIYEIGQAEVDGNWPPPVVWQP
ncbi:MAG: branched-chain amino acid ABC transporter substrate-binding protein [Caldilineaceae bacterium]|nr:branched-chain amino acid ABC transporter substrate-binding protein [Caldilineaceae bacterium]MCB9160769.1 branched-chain amino acid ABC transporter substrate-binding protein [Caldilineaceae bacterium]